jgi:23S rRNA (guanosine2251-2'-O)-methyltransferase
MIIYGVNPVLEAIRSDPRKLHYVAVSKEHGGKVQKVVAAAREAGVPLRFLPSEQIDRLAQRGVHNGVIADVSAGGYADFDEALESATLVLMHDGVTDPQNFGSILRGADACGIDLVVLPEHDSVGLTPAAVKASAGAANWVKVAQVTNLARSIEVLKKREFWVYAAGLDGEAPELVDFQGKVALVLGSEGKGIRRNVLEHCDRTITVPMSGHVDSLNVATAAAVLCYEVRRQHRGTARK